jgi:hypothetical protein
MDDAEVVRAMMAAAMAGGAGGAGGADMFPVKTKQWVQEVGGHSTDFVLCLFANCVFIIVTQLGKIGTMVHSPPHCTPPLSFPSDDWTNIVDSNQQG